MDAMRNVACRYLLSARMEGADVTERSIALTVLPLSMLELLSHCILFKKQACR